MTVPIISIILPTFNGSKYLEEAVSSCRCQTFSDWELIIVDDASTDTTPEIISRMIREDSRIRTVRHETNRKLPAALNTGFSLARGDFLTWTSDDNCYEPESLSKMIEYLSACPDIGVVYTDFSLIDEKSEITTKRVVVKDPCHLAYCNIIGPNFLYRRLVHEVLSGYDEGLFLVEDYDFWLRASIHFQMMPLHEVLYRYRLHSSSLTVQRRDEIALAHEKAFLRSINNMTWLNKKSRVLGLINASRLSRARGDWGRANNLLVKAVYFAPVTSCLILLRMLLCGPEVMYRIPLDNSSKGCECLKQKN